MLIMLILLICSWPTPDPRCAPYPPALTDARNAHNAHHAHHTVHLRHLRHHQAPAPIPRLRGGPLRRSPTPSAASPSRPTLVPPSSLYLLINLKNEKRDGRQNDDDGVDARPTRRGG